MRKNEDLVSIIVPVYNVEKYLKDCIDSLIKQTYHNIEIILIDDGSTDSSGEICNQYVERYRNIKVIHKSNGGLSSARNRGLEIMTGKYVTFVDSDDYLKDDCIESLANDIGKYDLLISGYERVSENGQHKFYHIPKNNNWDLLRFCNVAGKFYKCSFLKENNLLFSNVKYAEDVNFYLKVYSLTDKIKTKNYSGYCYRESSNSITTEKKYRDAGDGISYVSNLYQYVKVGKANRLTNARDKQMLMFLFQKTILFFCLSKRKMINTSDLYKEMKDSFDALQTIFEENDTKIKCRWQKGEKASINLLVNITVVGYKFKILKPIIFILSLM